MNESQEVIRAVLAPLTVDSLLLPSNVVAEIIDFEKPASHAGNPPWLLGDLEWGGWQVPIISFAILSGASARDPVSSSSRILIVKTLTDEPSLNYVGVLVNGLPKLKKVQPDSLEALPPEERSPVVFSRVALEGKAVLIPELQALTEEVAAAMREP